MKFRSKFLSVATAFLLAGTCLLGACNKKGSSNEDGVYDPTATRVEKDEYVGVHTMTAPDTEKSLVKSGTCAYKVVIPEKRSVQLNFAKEELVNFFYEATGITLEVITDEGLTHDSSNQYISLGETSLLQSSGIEVDKSYLTEDGIRIVTKDNSIYLVGGGDYGTLYAVYDFLQIYFNFDVYYKDCYEIDRNVTDLPLKAFDVTDIPDLEFRSNGYYNLVLNDWAYRFRQPRTYGTITFPIYEVVGDSSSSAKGVHNSFNWLPKDQFLADHDEWYADSGEELCYTAHGNEEELNLMLDACVDKAIATLQEFDKESYPYMRILNFTQRDNSFPCTCETCSYNREYYGTDVASIVLFMNKLRPRIEEEMLKLDERYYREDLTLTFFSYWYTEKAPSAEHEEMYLEDGVSVFLAMTRTLDYQSSIYTDSNIQGRENLKTWGKLSKEILLWTYSTKFTDFMYPVDTFSFYSRDAYEFFAANSVKLIYNQAQITQKGTTTAWHNLKAYLDSKLQWDSNGNAEYYIDKYMKAMYGKAAPQMRELYEAVRLQAGYVKTQYNGVTILGNDTDLADRDFWPYFTVKQWLAKLDEAYEAIAMLENTDPTSYALYKGHIDAEWLSPAYILLSLYGDMLSVTEAKEIKDHFREAVETTGITNLREIGNNQITDFMNSF